MCNYNSLVSKMSDYSDLSETDDDDDDVDVDEYFHTPILNNYDELMNLAKHDKTDDKLRDILYGLIKYVKIIKKKEIGFTFDYTIEPRQKWLDIAKEFNSNVVGRDYRILIDENEIVCYVINDDLLK